MHERIDGTSVWGVLKVFDVGGRLLNGLKAIYTECVLQCTSDDKAMMWRRWWGPVCLPTHVMITEAGYQALHGTRCFHSGIAKSVPRGA